MAGWRWSQAMPANLVLMLVAREAGHAGPRFNDNGSGREAAGRR
jgi:hypothetical protein